MGRYIRRVFSEVRASLAALVAGVAVLAAGAALHASEENFLPWAELRIVSADTPDTGEVVFVAEVRDGAWRAVRVEAFGEKYELDEQQREHLSGFRLSMITTTYGRGFDGVVGVYFKFTDYRWEDDRLMHDVVTISVHERDGLRVHEPRRRVIRERDE